MSQHPHNALVLLGGEPVDPALELPGDRDDLVVIAADSGVDQAHRLGLRVDVAVGDFDSVSAEGLARAVAEGAEIERHPADKDETDMELALAVASRRGAVDVVVAGGDGGRLDHLLANALVMASPRWEGLRIHALASDGARVHVVRDAATVAGAPGEYVSLLAVHGPAEGVRTDGLRYPLLGERLEAGSSRGVSNEMLGTSAQVGLDAGTLLVVLPGPSHTPHLRPGRT